MRRFETRTRSGCFRGEGRDARRIPSRAHGRLLQGCGRNWLGRDRLEGVDGAFAMSSPHGCCLVVGCNCLVE